MTLVVQHYYRHFYSLNVCLLSRILTVFLVSQAFANDPRNDPAYWDSLDFTPIHVMQGVNTSGGTTWAVPKPDGVYPAYKIRGVVLNDPALMLDGNAAFSVGPAMDMGAQWQIYIQAVDRPDNPAELIGDWGGATLWMGQNYGNHIYMYGSDLEANQIYSYSNEQWNDELERLNYPIDLSTESTVTDILRPGDLIEIHARGGKNYNGKFNCNEEHKKTDNYNFDIYIVERNLALPLTDVELSNIKNEFDEFVFDSEPPTRESGGEYYQGKRVRLQNVTITNPENWASYADINVTDGNGRSFTVKLGENETFDGTSAPTAPVDIIGIFDQEGAATAGYRLWALTPDAFLPADLLPGDANMDEIVNEIDAAIMATNWGKPNNAVRRQGDFNGDGKINQADAALLAQYWLQSPAHSHATAPEPGALVLMICSVFMLRILRKPYMKD